MRAQRAVVAIAVVVMVAAGCSGRADERAASDDGTATTEASGPTGSDASAEDSTVVETEASDEAVAALADPTTAATDAGFECADAPGLGGAARATCSAEGDITVELYAWESPEASTEGYTDTVRCPDGGPLSNLTAVRGPSWVMALMPAEGAAADVQGAIDVLSVQLQEATAQPVTVQPCSAPEE